VETRADVGYMRIVSESLLKTAKNYDEKAHVDEMNIPKIETKDVKAFE
jgi:hypothetical protein